MEVLLVLLVLAFPVIAIVGLVIAIGARDQVRTLQAQFEAFKKDAPRFATAAARPAPGSAPSQAPDAPAAHTPPPPPSLSPPPSHIGEPPRAAPPAAEPTREPSRPPHPRPVAPPVATAASVPPLSPPSPPPPPGPPKPTEPEMGFEERLGTQWTVWVGGVALALGGFFLVRYSIEQGWFGPAMRIVLGAVLALVLIAAGEWARRKENLSDIGSVPSAHIPSILTAAGTAVAYADVWAAYALYEFIGSGAAFVLLGMVALATLAAALVHGPALAGLGLVGAYVTPFVVASDKPNFWALYIYLAVVTAAAMLLARARLWRWLAFTAVAFSFFWTLPGLGILHVIGVAPHAFHVATGFALVAAFIVSGFLFGPDAEDGKVDPVSTIALAAYLFGALLIVLMSKHATPALTLFVVLTAATVAIAWRTEAAAGALPVAALMVLLMFLHYSVEFSFDHILLPAAAAGAPPSQVHYGTHLVLGAGLAVLFGGAGFLAQGRSKAAQVPMIWAACAVFVPIAILIALYYRIYKFEQSVPFAALALLLAVLFALATEMLSRREPRPGGAAAAAIFATGSVAGLALALALALEKGWLTVALALMVPGIAYVADKRPLPALRILAGVLVAAVLARVAWNPAIVGGDLGATPVFNWILWGYGVPALAFWVGGHILRRRADDTPARMADSAALLFLVLLAFLEVRHYMTGGNIYRPASPLTEVALHVNIWLAMAIGLERLRERSGSLIHNGGALIVTALALAGIVFGLAGIGNPMVFPYDVGGSVFNLVMLGYLLPAILMAGLALTTSGRRPAVHSQILGLVAVFLTLAYLSLQVRRILVGPVLTVGPTSLAEIAWNVNILIAMTLALEWLREKIESVIHNGTALLVGGIALIAVVFGLGIVGNPMLNPYNVGGSVFNLIMLGYLFPAALAAALALYARGRRPAGYSQLVAMVAVALALAYLSLQVRRFFHGPVLTIGPTTDAEQYTYSATWLVFGVVLLAVGVTLKSQAVRLASAVVVVLTVFKVFFVDMRDLTGIWQSISLIGLGVVLMGIGVVYQRILFPRRPRPPEPAAAPAPG